MWNLLKNKGYITTGEHTGFYSVNEETFFVEKDLVFDKEKQVYKTEMGEIVEKVQETNYKFRFADEVMDNVKEWAQTAVEPVTIRNKILDELS
jgi:methionyl-tRNA synthetase